MINYNNFYEPNREDILRFANFTGIRHKIKGNEVVFQYCPYCKANSKDKETFAINLDTGQFNCFRATCGVHGNMITLSKDFNFQISESVDRYINRNYFDSRFRKFAQSHKESTDPAIEYMRSRGISEDVCRKYEITTKSGEDRTLVFPFKDPDGDLKFIKYRNTKYKKGDDGAKEWCETDCMPILFGMNHCTDSKRLIITEGQIDSLSVIEAGIENAVSVPTGAKGTTWIPHCYDWISKHFDEIVVFGDCENDVVTLSDMIQSRFSKHKKVRIVRKEDYFGYKDANELLLNVGKQAIINAIDNAEMSLSLQVKDMADVEYVDLSMIPKVKTGFRKLDMLLGGGFMYGQVVLLTGKRGNGKSTFASHLLVRALQQDKNCFIYSGELPNFWVKNWVDRQIYGVKVLTNSQIEECENWYRGRLYVYNSDIVELDELDDLLTVLEDTIVKKDIKFAVIDNLMTAIEANTNEQLYRKQSEFVGKLAKMAKAYEMVIALVAHPRKTQRDFDNDDVSGSADITNRVDVVMSYDKDDKLGDSVRVLKVTKNRINGKLGEFTLYFSEDSKRISSQENTFEYRVLPELKEEVPDVIPY